MKGSLAVNLQFPSGGGNPVIWSRHPKRLPRFVPSSHTWYMEVACGSTRFELGDVTFKTRIVRAPPALANGTEMLIVFSENNSVSPKFYCWKNYSNIPVFFLIFKHNLYGAISRVI